MEDKFMDSHITNKLSNRWKKVLEVSKPTMMNPQITSTLSVEESADRKKILLARAMKNILRKKYSNETDDSIPKITTELAQPW